ncbi:MAG TPA: hypothetical protein PKM99_05745 [Thermotogota bacterium]|nr:hypothetical protein [Thermotogota bacterium]NLZ14542.1 hypothetical protein [Thermotogaceae bacterium]MDD8040388.1 hypothetical protein [Thermotogota bacterium]MDD8052889.1 hypothetical protein [Thermotogota bacterium]HNR63767.1 hypothetical protein [Thermotogota bacterium]
MEEVIQTVNVTDIYSFFQLLLTYWYIALPFSVALLFASRWFPKVLIAALGFVGGMFFLMPLLKTIPAVNDLLAGNPSLDLPIAILVGVICAVVILGLFKFVFFLGGLLIGFFIGVWIWNVANPWIIDQIRTQTPGFDMPQWIVWVFAGVFAIFIGIFAIVSHEKTVSFLSILSGALILDFYLLHFLGNFNADLFGTITKPSGAEEIPALTTIGLLVFVAALLILMFIGYRFSYSHWGRRKEEK